MNSCGHNNHVIQIWYCDWSLIKQTSNQLLFFFFFYKWQKSLCNEKKLLTVSCWERLDPKLVSMWLAQKSFLNFPSIIINTKPSHRTTEADTQISCIWSVIYNVCYQLRMKKKVNVNVPPLITFLKSCISLVWKCCALSYTRRFFVDSDHPKSGKNLCIVFQL